MADPRNPVPHWASKLGVTYVQPPPGAFDKLSTGDKINAAVDGALDFTALKAKALQSVKPATAARYAKAGVIGKALLPATMAAEAIQNTRQGWGNAIDQQRARVGDSHAYGFADGLSNPLTTLANAGATVIQAAKDKDDSEQIDERTKRAQQGAQRIQWDAPYQKPFPKTAQQPRNRLNIDPYQ